MPFCRLRAHRGYRRVHISARETGTHAGQIDPVGFAKPLKEELSDGSCPLPEDPGRREVDDVQAIVSAKQNVAVMEVGQGHSPTVEVIEDPTEAIKERIIKPGSRALPQWLGIDPLSGQGVGSEATEKCRQGVDTCSRLVRRRLATDQPATEAIPNHSASRRIRLDRHPLSMQLVKENICLGAVAAHDLSNRLDS